MRRGWIIAVSVVATLAASAALVLGIVAANLDRLGLGGPLPPAAGGTAGFGEATPGGPRIEDDPDWGVTEVYDVAEDGTLDPPADGLAAEVWDTFTRLVTQDFAAEVILTYSVGDSASADLLAYVAQDTERPEYWHFAANLAGATDTSYLLTTLIHEYAHILTLDLEQEPAGGGECEPEFRSQGCWYDDAYLAAFWDEFWRGYGDEGTEIGSEDDEARDAFYDAHEEDFVSSYAATSVEEDIAESFMAYVIEAVPDPSQSTVAAKLAFFERYPELAAIRERIRAEFGDELQPVWDE